MRQTFKEDLERDAKILAYQLRPLGDKNIEDLYGFVMMMEDFAGGPDRVAEYAKWIASPKRKEYRGRVAAFLQSGGH